VSNLWTMSTVEEIRCAIEKLPAKERGRLRTWLVSKDNRDWDRQIEVAAKAGKLAALAAEALTHKA